VSLLSIKQLIAIDNVTKHLTVKLGVLNNTLQILVRFQFVLQPLEVANLSQDQRQTDVGIFQNVNLEQIVQTLNLDQHVVLKTQLVNVVKINAYMTWIARRETQILLNLGDIVVSDLILAKEFANIFQYVSITPCVMTKIHVPKMFVWLIMDSAKTLDVVLIVQNVPTTFVLQVLMESPMNAETQSKLAQTNKTFLTQSMLL
jgi:hypothetical protein